MVVGSAQRRAPCALMRARQYVRARSVIRVAGHRFSLRGQTFDARNSNAVREYVEDVVMENDGEWRETLRERYVASRYTFAEEGSARCAADGSTPGRWCACEYAAMNGIATLRETIRLPRRSSVHAARIMLRAVT